MFLLLIFSQVIINEVMSNPKGSDGGAGSPGDRNEFIEVYNIGTGAVDLKGWSITDFDASDSLRAFVEFTGNGNTVISPGHFGIILDPEYIDSGDGTYFMPYNIPDSCVILTVQNTTIGNGLSNNDSLAIISKSGDTVSTYYHPFNPGDGISAERIDPYQIDKQDNWAACTESSGSTPGRQNAVYEPPGIYGQRIYFENDAINAVVINPSVMDIRDTLTLFIDKDRNRSFDPVELITKIPLFLESGKTDTITYPYTFGEGIYLIGVGLKYDTLFKYIRCEDGVGDIVINEFMPAPSIGCEWIEIYNRTDYRINIGGWQLGKSNIKDDVSIDSHSFIVFAEDSTEFFATYGNIPSQLYSLSLSLSNSGDTIDLFTPDTFIMDRVIYNKSSSGYSIERVNPDVYSDVESNWGLSIYAGGSPGEGNTIFAERIQKKLKLLISPKYFTPDGDGMNERTIISFTLPFQRNKIDIMIFDRQGHLRKKESILRGGEEGYYIWDGRDHNERTLPTGLYIVYVRIGDMVSRKFVGEKTTIYIGKK